MTEEQIKLNLCLFDKRNPDFNLLELDEDEIPAKPKNCFCDNCFYGRTKLAEELLKLITNQK